MRRSAAAKMLAALALLAGVLTVPLVGSAGAAPAQLCNGYTATTLSVSPTSVAAGGSVTLSGLGVPGETVTATLLSSPSSVIGSGVVSGGGTFSFGGTVPITTAAGTYTLQGSSTSCSSFVVSLTVTAPPPLVLAATTTVAPTTVAPTTVAPTTTAAPTTTTPATALSSCAATAAGRTFIPGQQVLWTLDSVGFDTTKQVRLRLRNASTASTLYALAAWPSGNQTTVTIPVGTAPGKYSIEQAGYTSANKPTTKNCPVTISSTPAAAAAQASAGSGLPIAVIAIAALTLFGLVQLRFRRIRRAV